MNILFSCGDFYPNPGGATSLVDDLARAVIARGHEVTVLTRRWPGTSASEAHNGYKIRRLDYPVLYEKLVWNRALVLGSLPILAQLARLLRELRITTVCIGLLDMSAWYLLLLRPILRFRLVLYLHGGETRSLPVREPSYAKLLRTALRSADAVIAVSEELRQEAARYWPDALTKTQVVVNAIDLDLIQAAKPMLHPRRYIAAVGRLVWEKDFATLIRAYANIQEEIGDMGLVIAGEGTQDATLREIAQTCRRPDHVTFLGKVEREEAISVIKGSEFLVLPSITEGFPIVVLEALAMGKAVVGTRIPGIQEMIEDGRQGNLFPVGDHIALSRLLRTYCHQPGYLVERSAAAASVNLDSYDIHKSALRHLQVFEASG